MMKVRCRSVELRSTSSDGGRRVPHTFFRVGGCCLFTLHFMLLGHLQGAVGAATGAAEQTRILTAFKVGIEEDPGGVLASWNLSSPIYSWEGVGCNGPEQVASLSLPGFNLKGRLNPSLFNLPFLAHLNLSSNRLRGNLPPELGNATNLMSLDLGSNLVTGTIPSSVGLLVNLKVLLLGSNNLSGVIPEQLGLCQQLVELELGTASDGSASNQLSGTIPSSLANCSALTRLRLSHSRLTGGIPAWIGSSLLKLQELDLSQNLLTGVIPASLGNLTGLVSLDLLDNAGLEGEIPATLKSCSNLVLLDLGMSLSASSLVQSNLNGTFLTSVFLRNMSSLQRLRVTGTQISGSLPLELGLLKSLLHLDLTANLLTGDIPTTLGNLSNLQYLDLSFNDLTGVIPRELGSCTNLSVLQLGLSSKLFQDFELAPAFYRHGIEPDVTAAELLHGVIPQELANLQNLVQLDIGYTDISGEVPSFKNCTSLRFLYLYRNKLEGSIPEFPSFLEVLNLQANYFTGQIPKAIGNLTALSSLLLTYNDLNGTIPAEVASCRNLVQVYIGGSSIKLGIPVKNSIAGRLPEELGMLSHLSQLVLSEMYLSGAIPASLGNCTSLTDLELNDNDLSGELPREIGNPTRLQVFRVSKNRLEGSLSLVNWGTMAQLEYLVLSRNNFSGTLPESLGAANLLKFLIATQNNFMGELPTSFRNASSLSLVDLQQNQLSGSISDALYTLSDTPTGRGINVVILSSNRFQGSIPSWIGTSFKSLFILILAGNQLDGTIPSDISLLTALQHPDLGNEFPREFHSLGDPDLYLTLKNVTEGVFVLSPATTILDLSGNNLLGEIPSELSALQGLRYLNFSHNKLVGSIPSSFGDLTSINQIDLSNNELTSSIPLELGELASLEYFDVSNNNLIGQIPQFGTRFSSSSYEGNPGLCGLPLLDVCATPPAPPPTLDSSSAVQDASHESRFRLGIPFIAGFLGSFITIICFFLCTKKGLSLVLGSSSWAGWKAGRKFGERARSLEFTLVPFFMEPEMVRATRQG